MLILRSPLMRNASVVHVYFLASADYF